MSEWTIARILEGIRVRAVASSPLNAKAVRREDRKLLDAAERLLQGGWQEALERAAERYPQITSIAAAVEAHRPQTTQPAEGTDGRALRMARFRAGLTQAQAAARIGVTQATWSLYESGGRGMVPPPEAWEAVDPERQAAKPSHGGARVGAGRKPRPEGSREAIIVLSPAAAAILDTVPAGERSAWVSSLIEMSASGSSSSSADASAAARHSSVMLGRP